MVRHEIMCRRLVAGFKVAAAKDLIRLCPLSSLVESFQLHAPRPLIGLMPAESEALQNSVMLVL